MNDILLKQTEDGVTTLTMNNPRRLNGWTNEMMDALHSALGNAKKDDDTKVVILTGTDPYYCAGVNLSGAIQFDHPKRLREMIYTRNKGLFDMFLDFPKPIIAAVNGPAIGASVTSATLCDAIVASEKATFSTPFAKLGVTPEGCSSVFFPKLIGQENMDRMLGKEGWQPTGEEAFDIGLVTRVVEHDDLMDEAKALASEWIAEDHTRSFREGMTKDELKAINESESHELADAFLAADFLRGQFEFLWGKKKRGPAAMFFVLEKTRPLWSKLL